MTTEIEIGDGGTVRSAEETAILDLVAEKEQSMFPIFAAASAWLLQNRPETETDAAATLTAITQITTSILAMTASLMLKPESVDKHTPGFMTFIEKRYRAELARNNQIAEAVGYGEKDD